MQPGNKPGCTECGAAEAICNAEGGAGHTHCRECAKPQPGRCTECGAGVPPVWMGPTAERPHRFSLRWLPGPDMCPRCTGLARGREQGESKEAHESRYLKSARLPVEALGWSFEAAETRAKALLSKADFELWWQGWQAIRYWNNRTRWPYLWGPARRGKTVFLYCLINACMERQRKTALFLSVTEFAALAGRSTKPDSEAGALIRRAQGARFLALDDLGAKKLRNERIRGALYEILDYRLKQQRPTAISSNYSYAELDKRIHNDFNRIIGRVVDLTRAVKLDGPNLTGARVKAGA